MAMGLLMWNMLLEIGWRRMSASVVWLLSTPSTCNVSARRTSPDSLSRPSIISHAHQPQSQRTPSSSSSTSPPTGSASGPHGCQSYHGELWLESCGYSSNHGHHTNAVPSRTSLLIQRYNEPMIQRTNDTTNQWYNEPTSQRSDKPRIQWSNEPTI